MNDPDGPVMGACRRGVRIEIDLRRNTIAVILGDPDVSVGPEAGAEQAGLLDVGAGGRLIRLEVGDHYVGISDALAGTEHLTRSVAVPLLTNRAPDGSLRAVLFGRSGTGTRSVSRVATSAGCAGVAIRSGQRSCARASWIDERLPQGSVRVSGGDARALANGPASRSRGSTGNLATGRRGAREHRPGQPARPEEILLAHEQLVLE